jgi:hypothetical protein
VLPRTDNPTGEAVICHTAVSRRALGTTMLPGQVSIWCFVPPAES